VGNQLFGVWGTGPADIWAVGTSGTILHFGDQAPTEYGGSCKAPIALDCGNPFTQYGSVMATNTNQFSTYSCGARTESSGEVYYKLEVPVTGTVKVDLFPFGGDLDLVAIGASSTGCDVSQCKGASQIAGTNVKDTLTLNVTQGQTYYFIVDGPSAANVSYTLQTLCTKL
jgi:hypothetical protein